MTSRLLPLGLVVALLTSTSAAALDLSGSLGGGYARTDDWSPGLHSDLTEWDWEASIAASGTLFRPGMLQWLVDAEYRGDRTLGLSTTALNGLTYHGQLALFTDSVAPVSLTAGRSWTQFTDSATAGIGTTIVTTEGGTAALRFANLPTLRFAVTHTDLENQSPGAGLVSSNTTGLDISASQVVAGFQYQLTYDTSWNAGTFAETNYQSHMVDAEVTSSVSDSLRLNFFDRYYLRDPTVNAETNPRYDDNQLGVGAQWRATAQTMVSLQYGYRDVVVQILGTPESEQIEHSVTNSDFVRLTPDLSFLGNIAVAYSLETAGTQRLGLVSESAGAGLTWRRKFWQWLSLDLSGGVTAGASEQSAQPASFIWGATWNVGGTGRWTNMYATAYYTGSYQSPASAGGEGTDQHILAQVEGIVNRVYLTGQVNLAETERTDPLLGLFKSESATALLGVTWRQLGAKLTGGLSEGLSDPLRNPDLQSGLLLPATLNTTAKFATFTVSLGADKGRLVFSAVARTMEIETPGHPQQYENGAGLTASYTIGAFMLSLDDEYMVGATGPTSQSVNRVMLRVIRNFGFSL